MTVSERILRLIDESNLTQKEFSERTGIPQSTISDWRKKATNPSSDKILIICKTLNVTPEWLLSGVEEDGGRANKPEYYVVGKESEMGKLLTGYSKLDNAQRDRVMGYVRALMDIGMLDKKEK
ncbi:helix-turn-helix domain-containing protein [Pseudobutyrivibrio xylanivorans]|uniref:Helix-turn-helix transcriptional regulator n=1 Tax=Pseudobutyrivibrio xylanivorans TaxID=185007 RepID=A0A5P6VSV9_PSEXY|nr:helix-turn-helix transcriptional regulator [Pseudobutyrivibrio xylanivorans]QFJ53931.1 helix-turn-helix transcriptional regulator [Pseudobutyrivibrio xylanivorans]